MNLAEAQALLQAEGLETRSTGKGLLVADSFRDVGNGIHLSNDATLLVRRDDGRWWAYFPGPGLSSYEISGDLPDLVSQMIAVYAHFRQGGSMQSAFERTIGNPPGPIVS